MSMFSYNEKNLYFSPYSVTLTEDQIVDLIDTLDKQSRLTADDPAVAQALLADYTNLERFNIVKKGLLFLRPEATVREAIVASRTMGSNKLWSNALLYEHLTFLTNNATVKNGISSRMIIDAIIFRSNAMLPYPDHKMFVIQENKVPAVCLNQSQSDTTGTSGMVNYTMVVAEPIIAENCLHVPLTQDRDKMIAFLVSEVKAPVPIMRYLPEVLPVLMANAKDLGKSHIRGAITTGFEWLFIQMDLDGDGAKYWTSGVIEWSAGSKASLERCVKETSDYQDPALIAGILSTWIPESFSEYNGDQWFVL